MKTDGTPTCPRCRSPWVVLGEVTRGRTLGAAESFGFRAYAARLSSFRRGVAVTRGMCACSECGLLWGQLAPELLLSQLRQLATSDVREWLDSARPSPI
jgi:hypothetical protein